MWQRTQYLNRWKLVVQYVVLHITPLLMLIFSKSCMRYCYTHCVWMKSSKAADFSAPNATVEGVLCFMSGNVKAILENVLHVQNNNRCWLKQNVVETVVVINIPGNWHPKIFRYSCLKDLYHLTSAWEQEYSASRVHIYWTDGRERVRSTIYCHKSCRRGQTGRWEVKLVKWGFNPGYTSLKKKCKFLATWEF